MNVEIFPATATCQEMADYFAWFVKVGRGTDKAMLDQRGLGHLVQPHFVGKPIGLCLPPAEEADNAEMHKVFVRPTF
jgi:hypothetical protein